MEHLRESLLGTYDIYMGRLAQRSNDVMKALTVLSAILLPSVVLAGVMGMNFKVGFFDESSYFFVGHRRDGRDGGRDPRDRALAGLARRPARRRPGPTQSRSTCSANPNSAPPSDRGRAQMRPPIAAIRRAHTNRPIPAPLAVRAVPGER